MGRKEEEWAKDRARVQKRKNVRLRPSQEKIQHSHHQVINKSKKLSEEIRKEQL